MSVEKKEEQALELAKEAVKDLNEIVKDWTQAGVHIPFLSTFFAFAGLAIAQWEKAKFEEFLDQIRVPLAFNNIGQVGAHIAQNIHHRWMADGLAQGWRLGLETMNDTARKCAYFMVADYMAMKKVPDREYHQLSRLFKEADERILRTLLIISDALLPIKGSPSLVGSASAPAYWEYGVYGPDGAFHALNGHDWDFAIEEACEAAINAHLGVHWSNPELRERRPGHSIAQRFCEVSQHHVELWVKLQGYLKPVL